MKDAEFDKALVALPSDEPWVRLLRAVFEEVQTSLSMSMIRKASIEVRLHRKSHETGQTVEVRISLYKFSIFVQVGTDHERELEIPLEGRILSEHILDKATSYAAQRAMMDVGL